MTAVRPRLTSRLLEFFLGVVEAGSVSQAALRLHVSQPSVSEAIRTLERELGTDLFVRTRRGMTPTEAGLALVEPARQVLDGLAAAERTAREVTAVERGSLDISVPSGLIVEPFARLAHRFRAAYPNVPLHVLKPTGIDRVVLQVHRHMCDVGVAYVTEKMPGSLEVCELDPVELVLAFPPQLEPPDGVVTPDVVAHLPLIVLSPLTTPRRALDRWCRAFGIQPNVAVEANHEGGYLQLVLAGAGVAVFSRESARLATAAGLEVRSFDPPLRLPVGVVHRAGEINPAAEAFVSLARTAFPDT